MIRIKIKKNASRKETKRLKNKARVRKKVNGSMGRPRLTVFRSGRHIYAQLIDDNSGRTLAAASTLQGKKTSKNLEGAKWVGMELAKKAKEKSIERVVFDRSGYVYHGRVQAVAEGAREGGLKF